MKPAYDSQTKEAKTGGCRCEEFSGAALAEDMRRFAQEKLAKPGEALAFLVKVGIVNPDGKLTEPYR